MITDHLHGFCSGRVNIVDDDDIGSLKLMSNNNNIVICEPTAVKCIEYLNDYFPSKTEINGRIVYFCNQIRHFTVRKLEKTPSESGLFLVCNPKDATHYYFPNNIRVELNWNHCSYGFKVSDLTEAQKSVMTPLCPFKPGKYKANLDRKEVIYYANTYQLKKLQENPVVTVTRSRAGGFVFIEEWGSYMPIYLLEVEKCA